MGVLELTALSPSCPDSPLQGEGAGEEDSTQHSNTPLIHAFPWAQINLSAWRHNLAQVRRQAPEAKIMAVIKANAYGHGVAEAARALDGADAFALARLDEALTLRELGVTKSLVVMGGAYLPEVMRKAARQNIRLGIHQPSQIDVLERLPRAERPQCLLKLDTGMHRLGFQPDETEQAWQRLLAMGCLEEEPLLLSHLASADDPRSPQTEQQWDQLQSWVQKFGCHFSIANSALIMSRPQMLGHWVRPGIMLYGASPFEESTGPELDLRPVMTLKTRLVAIKHLAKGEPVGYSATWTSPEAMPLGIAAIGYGDGYPRHAPSGTPVLVNGVQVPLVGRVSMDMITLDLRNCPDARPGDEVCLWGQGLPAELVARSAGTIVYQLFCNVSKRVAFHYG